MAQKNKKKASTGTSDVVAVCTDTTAIALPTSGGGGGVKELMTKTDTIFIKKGEKLCIGDSIVSVRDTVIEETATGKKHLLKVQWYKMPLAPKVMVVHACTDTLLLESGVVEVIEPTELVADYWAPFAPAIIHFEVGVMLKILGKFSQEKSVTLQLGSDPIAVIWYFVYDPVSKKTGWVASTMVQKL